MAAGAGPSQLEEMQAKAEIRSRKKLLALKSQMSGVINESGASLERIFRAFDTNRDGVVDYDECVANRHTWLQPTQRTATNAEIIPPDPWAGNASCSTNHCLWGWSTNAICDHVDFRWA